MSLENEHMMNETSIEVSKSNLFSEETAFSHYNDIPLPKLDIKITTFNIA